MTILSTKAAPAAVPRYRNQAAQRVLAVLACFAGPERDLGVTELALRLGMNKNMVHRALTTLAAQGYVAKWISSFKEFPPRQKPASFSVDEVMKKLEATSRGR